MSDSGGLVATGGVMGTGGEAVDAAVATGTGGKGVSTSLGGSPGMDGASGFGGTTGTGGSTVIRTPWQSRGVGGGGALFTPAISPFDNRIYMSTDMGAVFYTGDFGASWTTVDFRALGGGANAQLRFTADPNTLYGIPSVNESPTLSVSTNGGTTFQRTAGNASDLLYLEVDPTSTQRLLVGDYGTLYFSNNGGITLASVYEAADSGAGLILGGAFWDGTTVYVGTNDGLLVSTNNGASFALQPHGGIASGEVMVSFAGAKTATTTRFFAVTAGSGDAWAGVSGCELYSSSSIGVYRLDVGDTNWTAVTSHLPAGQAPTFVGMAKDDVSVAYVAGSDTQTGAPSVAKTADGGATWSSVFKTTNNANIATGWSGDGGDSNWGFGECAEGFTVLASNANRVVMTDMGFVHVTSDGGAHWSQAYVNPLDQNPEGAATPKGKAYRSAGVEQTSHWWLTWPDANSIFSSVTDIKSVRSTDAGVHWMRESANGLSLNTTYQTVLPSASSTMYAATSSIHDMYMSYRLTDSTLDSGSGAVMQSTDAGAHWTTVHSFGHPVVSLAIDPNNNKSMYASVVHSTKGGIFHTSQLDQGTTATWSQLVNPPRTEGHPYNIVVLTDGTLVTTYSGRRTSTGFTDSSGVFVSNDGGTTWLDRSDAKMHYWTKDLVIDPNDSAQQTWYVGVFQQFGGGPAETNGLYRTTDRGQHWTPIWQGGNVESCTIDPRNPDRRTVEHQQALSRIPHLRGRPRLPICAPDARLLQSVQNQRGLGCQLRRRSARADLLMAIPILSHPWRGTGVYNLAARVCSCGAGAVFGRIVDKATMRSSHWPG
jgi:photosystem II stability/assembly factor-like uncharacterized protein